MNYHFNNGHFSQHSSVWLSVSWSLGLRLGFCLGLCLRLFLGICLYYMVHWIDQSSMDRMHMGNLESFLAPYGANSVSIWFTFPPFKKDYNPSGHSSPTQFLLVTYSSQTILESRNSAKYISACTCSRTSYIFTVHFRFDILEWKYRIAPHINSPSVARAVLQISLLLTYLLS